MDKLDLKIESGEIFMGFKGWDLTNAESIIDQVHAAVQANQNAIVANVELQNLAKEEQRRATIETAKNTTEMKEDLKTVIHNQNDYITMLKEQNDYIRELLNNMFGSSEDSIIIQKEILKIMKESKATDGMIADKGMDVVIQLVFNAIQIYLKSRGIMI